MRSPGVVSLLLCLGLAGCTSSSGIDDLMPRPSMEMTSSIARPDGPVSATRVARLGRSPSRDSSDKPEGLGPAPALLEPETPPAAVLPDEVPVVEAALVAPERPSAPASAFKRGIIHERRFRDAKPINFGRRSPRHLAVHGVDVSRWQGDIDWAKLRGQGANFVYIKAAW